MTVVNLDLHRAIKQASEPKNLVDETVWIVSRKVPLDAKLDRLERDALLAQYRRFEKEMINLLGMSRAIGRPLPLDTDLQRNLAETKSYIFNLK